MCDGHENKNSSVQEKREAIVGIFHMGCQLSEGPKAGVSQVHNADHASRGHPGIRRTPRHKTDAPDAGDSYSDLEHIGAAIIIMPWL